MFAVNRRMYCYNYKADKVLAKQDFDDYLNNLWCEDLEEYNEILTIENSM